MRNLILSILSLIFFSVQLNGQTDYDKAVEHFNNREFEKAIPLFKDYLKTIDDLEAVINVEEYIALCYFYISDYDNTYYWTNDILNKDSQNERALLINLKVSIKKEDFKLMQKTSNSLIEKLGVREGYTYYYRGLSLFNFGEFDLALNDMQRAYDFDNSHAGVNYHLGILYNQLKDYDKAIPLLYKSIDLNFQIDECFYNLTFAYYNKKDYKTAQYFLNKTLETNPDYFHSEKLIQDFNYMQSEIHYNLGQYRKAIPYLEQITDKTYENYARVTIITVSSYENLEEEYTKRGELDKAAYFAAKRAERVLKETFIEDGLETIDRAISLDSSLHYLLFKSQAMILKIAYYIKEEVFESEEEATAFSREALALTNHVYREILALDPENEYYLNRYIEDLSFFGNIFYERAVIEELCEIYDKVETFGYDYDKKMRNIICKGSKEDYNFDYDVILTDLEPFEDRFGIRLEDDVE